MRKIIIMLLVFVLVLTVVGCENTNNANSSEDSSNLTTENEITENEDKEEFDPYAPPKRSAIPEEYKWDLSTIYANDSEFNEAVSQVRSDLEILAGMDNQFSNKASFLKLMTLFEEVSRKVDTIYVFASLQTHTDTANTDFSDLEDIASQVSTEFSEATSYMYPSIANMNADLVNSYLNDPDLKNYHSYIRSIVDEKEHILSMEEEELLAQAEILYEVPESIYDAFNYLTDYSDYLPEPNWDLFWTGTREDKKDALEAYYLKNGIGIQLLSEIYESEIKKNTFFAEARNYDSALESALANDGMTREAYNQLFTIMDDNLDLVHRWISLKKDLLGIEDQMHIYDLYTPLLNTPPTYIEYEPGKEVIYEALAPLGEEYINDLKEGFNSRWVDVFTTEGKYQGGYQWGTYDTTPFVLLNFYGMMTDVSTVAHEMGHALNFKYSNETNPYFESQIPIFNAEIASTTNESLVFEYRIRNASNKAEKQEALINYIELIENTIVTQMMYADFEKQAYEAYENNEPISADLFNKIMGDIYLKYYGEDFALDEITTYQWAEIPHFYNAYYVYKYATGLSAGLSFSDMILNGNQEDLDKYIEYLHSGSSDKPLTVLKNAGVDFSTGEPLQKAFDKFEELLNEFEGTLE
jgi:oligoendopeptidase F